METSEKIIREATENQEGSAAYYKKAIVACIAEIKEIVERIHQSVEERAHKSDDFDRQIARLVNESQERIEQHQRAIARLESENAILRAKLEAF